MEKWSDKYIGLKYKWGSHNLKEGSDCIRLTEEILKREKNYHVNEGDKPVTQDWYVNNPDRLIRQGIEHGEVITNITKLREFDAVFFKIKNSIRHVGIMTDDYGYFVHQLQGMTSRLDSLHQRHWKRRFYCGVRPNYSK